MKRFLDILKRLHPGGRPSGAGGAGLEPVAESEGPEGIEIEVDVPRDRIPSDRIPLPLLKQLLERPTRDDTPKGRGWRAWLHIGDDIAHGVHSGIPICCVLFYALVWPTLWAYPRLFRRRLGPELREYYWGLVRSHEKRLPLKKKRVNALKGARLERAHLLFRPEYDYIPCPICLHTCRVVPIRDCDKEDCDCEWRRAEL
jgi:hypothetical protein